MARKSHSPDQRTDLTPGQIAAVIAALGQMRDEEAARTPRLEKEERGRGPMDRLAQRLGVTQGSISHYLSGTRNPGSPVAEALMREGRLDPVVFRGPNPELSVIDPQAPRYVTLTPEQVARLRSAASSLVALLDDLKL